jgi:hypothetical protein
MLRSDLIMLFERPVIVAKYTMRQTNRLQGL